MIYFLKVINSKSNYMSRNTMIVLVVAILVVGGLVLFSSKDTAPVDESPDSGSTVVEKPVDDTPAPAETRKASVPLVTTDSKATPSETTVVLTGKVNPNGAFTSYWYEYSLNSNIDSKLSASPKQMIGSGYLSINAPAYITGLAKDTRYYFRLVAENSLGKVSGAQYSFQTVAGNPAPVGSAPSPKTLAANVITQSTANLNGEVTPNEADTVYWFEYGKSANLGNTSAIQNVGNGNSKVPVSISVSNLDAGTTYYFRLNAQNKFGTVNGSILNFKTAAAPAVKAPEVDTKSATAVTTSSARLHGSVNPGGAATNYWFEYSTDSLLGSVLVEATDSTSVGSGQNEIEVEANISGLNPDTNYYFRIVARNSVGTVVGDKMSFKTK